MSEVKAYIFDADKDAFLKKERGAGFDAIIQRISEGGVLNIVTHPNVQQYPDQFIAIVELNDYAWQVPFRYENDSIRLITAFPSRKCTKKYLEDKEHA